ncbi:Condensin complex subunit 3 [Gracilaria domingensis]|nr:Condensin complex subunit 3 [Gracilaria domingensis]
MVRVAAAGALCRIQTSRDPDDEIFCARLIHMLSLDSSTAVRKAALNAIALTEHTIPFVVARTRDLHPNSLTISDRVKVLKKGLTERSESVREACERNLLLQGWLDGACQGNIFELIDLWGAHEFEEDVLHASRVVFVSERCQSLVEAIQLDVNDMSGSDVLVLRAMSHTQNAQSSVQKFLPTTTIFSHVLHYYAVDKFAIHHLLDLCRAVDMSDEVGRVNLEKVLRSAFLQNKQSDEEVIPSAVRALRRLLSDVNDTLRIVLEILRNDILLQSEPEGENDVAQSNIEDWRHIRALNI